MTKQEILDHFKDINEAYNDCTRFESLSRMLDELLESTPQIIRCRDCRFAHLTYDGLCKQCDNATDDDDIKLTLYLPGDFYCAFAERKDGDGE